MNIFFHDYDQDNVSDITLSDVSRLINGDNEVTVDEVDSRVEYFTNNEHEDERLSPENIKKCCLVIHVDGSGDIYFQ